MRNSGQAERNREEVITIVIGFAERDAATGIFYNAAAACSHEGYIAVNYRKNFSGDAIGLPRKP